MAEENKEKSENEVPAVAEDDIESLKQALVRERERAERYLVSWQRAEADFRNYKMREEQEKGEMIKWANSALVCDILPVLDAFDRAFEGVVPTGKGLSWISGFRQIQRMLLDVLKRHGVDELKCVGEAFDPSLHEAVAQGEGAEGIILDVTRKGYKLKERLLRAPQVVVGKGIQMSTNETIEKSDEEKSGGEPAREMM